MYLKQLEMTGFKSFPEKIRLEFNEGITAVVGPNGSGKSNISDAIRWVLGEQSVKTLRGSKMEDVIFVGTANRKPLGYAEVKMTIDNSDRGLNIDFNEITLSRKVYRSGDSEYAINGALCRLKDIHELFMDTGIGKEGYSIIGQGRIEEILSAKGEERRQLFEEASGIIKYKNRRFEALNKLEKEKQNLVRVMDIIEEIEGSLEPLKEQSEKAKSFLSLAESLKLVRISIFLNEVANTKIHIDKIDKDSETINSQIDNESSQKEKIESDIGKLKSGIYIYDNSVEELNIKLMESRSAYEQAENDIILNREQKENVLSDIEMLKSRINEISEHISENDKERYNIDNLLKGITAQIDNKSAAANEKTKVLQSFSTEMTDEELAVEQINGNIIKHMQMLSDLNSDINKAENSYDQLEERMEHVKLRLSETEEKLETQIKAKEELEESISALNINMSRLSKNLTVLESEKNELTEKADVNSVGLNNNVKSLSEINYRIKVLSELENSYEGYSKPVKALLSQKWAKESGILGAVGENVIVEKPYETAIEIALGSSIQNIITQTEDGAKKAIEFLKKTGNGRITFLPISSIKPRADLVSAGVFKEEGFVNIAYNLVKFDYQFDNIFSSLLNNTIIVDNMDAALRISKKYGYKYRIVTLQGELFNIGGSITGGSSNNKTLSIFGRKSEIKTLKQQVGDYEIKIAEYEEEKHKISRQLSAVESQIQDSKNKLQNIEIEKSSSVQKLNQAEELIREYKNKQQNYHIDNKQLMVRIVENNATLRTLESKRTELEETVNELKIDLNNASLKIASKRLEKDTITAELTDLRVELSKLEEKAVYCNDKISSLLSSNEKSALNIEKLKIDILAKEKVVFEKENFISQLMLQAESFKSAQANLQKELELKRCELDTLKKDLEGLEALNIEKLNLLSELTNARSQLFIQKEHIDENLRKIYDSMWDEYEITYQQALAYDKLDMTGAKLHTEERRLKNAIKDLGNVNVGAIEEYKAVSERYTFLSNQAEDIKEAELKLKNIFSQLTELMERQFKEHFKIISDNFNIVFKEIFGGGTASLTLSDENNVLESGIDIVAKPPGKSLQNLTLLSGGERSLTAVALLFAILRMKPSPFCVLDEIESALDDANVVRYVNYLQNFCTKTQFILITHRKSVMEAADVLYGITMQEQGVSTLVSVKFEDASA